MRPDSNMRVLTLGISSLALIAAAADDPALYFGNEVYSSWWASASKDYKSSLYLNSTDDASGVALFWTIDGAKEIINIAVACPVGKGWCGFGLAESGAMKGSDMVIYESETNELYDAYVLDDINAGPIRDECQNWIRVNSISSGEDTPGIMIFEASRSLNTGDAYDRPIVDDSDMMVPSTLVIAAWGETPKVSYHGNNRARSSLRFFRNSTVGDADAFQLAMTEEAEGSFELRAIDYPVPEVETEYAHFCFTYSDLVAMGVPEDTDLHIIGIEPFVDDDAKKFVHHFILSASSDMQENVTTPLTMDECRNLSIIETAYVWAPGEGTFEFPSNLGAPLGLNGFRSFKLEVHYNNPGLVGGVVDSSGVKVYWSSKKREMDMGILQLGDPFVSLMDSPVGSGLTYHTFDCPASCSTYSLSAPVTVIREYLHMHKKGERMYNSLIRNGTVVHTGLIDYFDFEQQGNQPVQQGSFQIFPGDSFSTRCYYNAGDELFGLGSQNEMCISFIFYYPRQTIEGFPFLCGFGFDQLVPDCGSTYDNSSISEARELSRVFGGETGVCEKLENKDTEDKSAASVSFSSLVVVLCLLAAML